MPRGHPNYLYGLPPSNSRSYVRKKSVARRSVTYKEAPQRSRDKVTGRYNPQYRPRPQPRPPTYVPVHREQYEYNSD